MEIFYFQNKWGGSPIWFSLSTTKTPKVKVGQNKYKLIWEDKLKKKKSLNNNEGFGIKEKKDKENFCIFWNREFNKTGEGWLKT